MEILTYLAIISTNKVITAIYLHQFYFSSQCKQWLNAFLQNGKRKKLNRLLTVVITVEQKEKWSGINFRHATWSHHQNIDHGPCVDTIYWWWSFMLYITQKHDKRNVHLSMHHELIKTFHAHRRRKRPLQNGIFFHPIDPNDKKYHQQPYQNTCNRKWYNKNSGNRRK